MGTRTRIVAAVLLAAVLATTSCSVAPKSGREQAQQLCEEYLSLHMEVNDAQPAAGLTPQEVCEDRVSSSKIDEIPGMISEFQAGIEDLKAKQPR